MNFYQFTWTFCSDNFDWLFSQFSRTFSKCFNPQIPLPPKSSILTSNFKPELWLITEKWNKSQIFSIIPDMGVKKNQVQSLCSELLRYYCICDVIYEMALKSKKLFLNWWLHLRILRNMFIIIYDHKVLKKLCDLLGRMKWIMWLA